MVKSLHGGSKGNSKSRPAICLFLDCFLDCNWNDFSTSTWNLSEIIRHRKNGFFRRLPDKRSSIERFNLVMESVFVVKVNLKLHQMKFGIHFTAPRFHSYTYLIWVILTPVMIPTKGKRVISS